MSPQRSLEQKRAAAAWGHIADVRNKKFAKDYGSLARSAPADIQSNGLGQTLAFWRAKGYEWNESKKQSEPKKDNEHAQILLHVSAWLRSQKILPDGKDAVEWIAKDASANDYRRATSEVIAYASWLKRFAEAELPKGD